MNPEPEGYVTGLAWTVEQLNGKLIVFTPSRQGIRMRMQGTLNAMASGKGMILSIDYAISHTKRTLYRLSQKEADGIQLIGSSSDKFRITD
jgi:hypothetical protein